EASVATLKYTQRIAGLRGFEPRQRLQERKQSLGADLFGRGRRQCKELPRLTRRIVTFTKQRRLKRHRAVVVEGGAPEERTMRHEAVLDFIDDVAMAARGTARLRSCAQITRIDEAHVLKAFTLHQRVRSLGVRGRRPVPL